MNRLPHLRMRLALRALAITLAALAVIVSAGWVVSDRIIARNAETSADDFLQTLVGELAVAGSPFDPGVSVPILDPGEDRIGQILDLSTGEVLVASPGFSESPLVPMDRFTSDTPTTGEIPDPIDGRGRMFVEAAVSTVGADRYGVIAGVSGNSFTLAAWPTVVMALAVICVSVGVAAVVWFSVRSAFRPVEAVSAHADQIAETIDDQSWQLPVEATTSEIQHLIDRLNSLLARVHASRQHERVFLEDASHDLRTPIAVARAELDLAHAGTNEADTREALASAIEELDRLDRLSADLLILAKMRAGPTRSREQVHLGRLVRTTAARLARDPYARDIKVTVAGSATSVGDSSTLERAVSNVLRNAMRHAESRVDVSIDSRGDLVRISTRDDGAGFPPELLASATDRFARHDDRSEGTGLGLSIASAIVEAHGGDLELENAADGGAVVVISLPSEPERATNGVLH